MGDGGSYPALRLLLLVLAAAAIAIPLGRAMPAANGLEYSASIPSSSVASQDFFHTPVPEFPFPSTSSPVALPLASYSVPPPPSIHKTFFSRAIAPFERLLRSCFLEDVPSIGDCLKEKAILALSRASGMESVPLGGSIALVKENRSEVRSAREGEEERRNEMDGSVEDVDSRLIKGFAEFLRGRALRVSLPESIVPLVQQSLQEARGKKQKLGTLITCVAVILKTLAIATIAFIAKKALLVGKLALLLSAALMFKKLMGGGGGGGGGGGSASGTSYEVVSLHRRSNQRDLPRHAELYHGYGVGETVMEREDEGMGGSLAYGGYALVRRGKRLLDVGGEAATENLRERS